MLGAALCASDALAHRSDYRRALDDCARRHRPGQG